jgi:nucleotide-binding universal stress UspA family protein
MTDGQQIVVGVDPSDSARDAALWAADLAAARGCGLELAHVASTRPGALPDWLRELADAAERAGATPVRAEVVRGTPFDVLLTRSHRAAMIVVGSFGRDAPAGMLVGSTALTLVARAGCPVAVVRGGAEGLAPPRGGPVLVGVDGTPASDAALDLAAELGAALGAGLLVVHGWFDVATDAGGAAHLAADSWSEQADNAERTLADQLARTAAHRGAVPVERRLVAGTPLRVLLELAGAVRMAVVAQRGHVPPGGMHLGSTSRGLVEFAPCPVVVARTGAARPSPAPTATG